ncbi:lipoprotein signal peptidase [Clostridium tepidiprofundi DSM 19306]|uniref:Lipoprotein signal peptidase n=1 Tax=Clostridium tepidiprofundi DSM 19306 TaxID=1121338 RepID=A0A151B6V7_9CLOT|nr:signal peptidase II [Clostridium tepidiprofundi]KYH35668.1 lipoprotein signal peptidase [Clostridium tepidiprofundi DSM 19306]
MELIIIFIGLTLDRITKIWASTLKGKEGIVVVRNFFRFEYLENRGAAFGIFQHKLILLSVVTIIVVSAMGYYLISFRPKSKFLRFSLALIISGAIGNLIDRMFYKYVIDFILLHYKDVYYYPTFNVADILVVTGTIMLAILIIKDVD